MDTIALERMLARPGAGADGMTTKTSHAQIGRTADITTAPLHLHLYVQLLICLQGNAA
jgi:hypothetical protein